MKMKKTNLVSAFVCIFCFCFMFWKEDVEASEGGEEYITIEVQASDDNENLKYAIDSDDEAAFSDTNAFTIPAGTSHTIYVKDAAGNITSQTYTPDNGNSTSNSDEQQINIDLELGNSKGTIDYSEYEYLTDYPVASGTGTVSSKITTDGSDSAEKVFYTVSTDNGEVFYLVIDQASSTNNVYLLNDVTLDDLESLASDSSKYENTKEDTTGDNLLSALKGQNETEDIVESDTGSNVKKKSLNNNIIILVIVVIGGGVYYYLKVYKNKKDEMMDTMEAMDMEEFEADIDDEDDEIEFDVDDEEKERFLEQLIEEDEDEEAILYDVKPDEYFDNNEKRTEKSIDDEVESVDDSIDFEFDDLDIAEEDEEEE